MSTLNSDKAWKSYGKKNAYYGVLAHDEFLDENLSEDALKEFFTSGFSDVENIFNLIHKHISKDFTPSRILDFGCGTGRLVIPFAKKAEEVVGVDISPQMISEAQKNAKNHQLDNISFFLSDNNLSNLKGQSFDLIHSYIVLQHINVNRGEKLIKKMVSLLKPGGVGVLQMTYHSNKSNFEKTLNYFRYRVPFFNNVLNIFRGKAFNLPLMQMNSYDMNKVFFILQTEGVSNTQVIFTDHGGYLGLTLLFQK